MWFVIVDVARFLQKKKGFTFKTSGQLTNVHPFLITFTKQEEIRVEKDGIDDLTYPGCWNRDNSEDELI